VGFIGGRLSIRGSFLSSLQKYSGHDSSLLNQTFWIQISKSLGWSLPKSFKYPKSIRYEAAHFDAKCQKTPIWQLSARFGLSINFAAATFAPFLAYWWEKGLALWAEQNRGSWVNPDEFFLQLSTQSLYTGRGREWAIQRQVIEACNIRQKGTTGIHLELTARAGRLWSASEKPFLLRKSVVSDANLEPTGYKILLEVLVMGQFHRLTEVPYCFFVRERGESKLKS
jgi:hypothetical protein